MVLTWLGVVRHDFIGSLKQPLAALNEAWLQPVRFVTALVETTLALTGLHGILLLATVLGARSLTLAIAS